MKKIGITIGSERVPIEKKYYLKHKKAFDEVMSELSDVIEDLEDLTYDVQIYALLKKYAPKNIEIVLIAENLTHAEYIILDQMNIHPKPDHLTFENAASMPLVFMTAHQMLIKRAKLQSFETVLVYGGTSGVGAAAIQISKELGAQVIATAGNYDKCDLNHRYT